MSYSLILIDMQPYFEAANSDRVQKYCLQELKRAMHNLASIIFVEYEGCGPTVDSLIQLTDNYTHRYFVEKHQDDGAPEISDLIWKHNLHSKKIKVCGVNTDCCVRATVSGMSVHFPKASIEVISSACNSDLNHFGGLSLIKNILNVSIR